MAFFASTAVWQSGLADVAALRGATEVAFVRKCHQVAQVAEIHAVIIDRKTDRFPL